MLQYYCGSGDSGYLYLSKIIEKVFNDTFLKYCHARRSMTVFSRALSLQGISPCRTLAKRENPAGHYFLTLFFS